MKLNINLFAPAVSSLELWKLISDAGAFMIYRCIDPSSMGIFQGPTGEFLPDSIEELNVSLSYCWGPFFVLKAESMAFSSRASKPHRVPFKALNLLRDEVSYSSCVADKSLLSS